MDVMRSQQAAPTPLAQLGERLGQGGPARLAQALSASGAFPVLLSTNLVFDGTVPYRGPDDPVCPRTEYGRQKAAAERAVLAAGGAVVRLTKVLGPDDPLVTGWVARLRRGEPVELRHCHVHQHRVVGFAGHGRDRGLTTHREFGAVAEFAEDGVKDHPPERIVLGAQDAQMRRRAVGRRAHRPPAPH